MEGFILRVFSFELTNHPKRSFIFKQSFVELYFVNKRDVFKSVSSVCVCVISTLDIKKIITFPHSGEQGWGSGESTRLPLLHTDKRRNVNSRDIQMTYLIHK